MAAETPENGDSIVVADIEDVIIQTDEQKIADHVFKCLLTGRGFIAVEGRPEGRDGPLTRSLDGYSAYWDRWAEPWEFQALLKACPVAGDLEVGRQFVEMVSPMVWSAADREGFVDAARAIFPDRPIVDIPDDDPIFHTIYDLDERFQIPVVAYVYHGRTYERDGVNPEWKGVYDDNGRLMVAICHNMDIGDAWEWADEPRYPEKFASLAYRIGINYIVYAMTH